MDYETALGMAVSGAKTVLRRRLEGQRPATDEIATAVDLLASSMHEGYDTGRHHVVSREAGPLIANIGHFICEERSMAYALRPQLRRIAAVGIRDVACRAGSPKSRGFCEEVAHKTDVCHSIKHGDVASAIAFARDFTFTDMYQTGRKLPMDIVEYGKGAETIVSIDRPRIAGVVMEMTQIGTLKREEVSPLIDSEYFGMTNVGTYRGKEMRSKNAPKRMQGRGLCWIDMDKVSKDLKSFMKDGSKEASAIAVSSDETACVC